ncbi:MAG TPA: choice-of-anchor Q domain-containing protein [Kiritimatiellia bacterium]|nr:choice-of-anchor Q domain-containing protein [Kiritimatiellia bacterium]
MRRMRVTILGAGLLCWLVAACPGLMATTITVNSNGDPGGFDTNLTVGTLGPVVTLRDAITAANNTPGDDAIVFSGSMNGATVTLVQATSTMDPHGSPRNNGGPTALRITSNIELIAPAGGLVILPTGLTRLFDIAPGATVRVERLTLRGGVANNGGGFWNAGDLTLDEVTMTSFVASSLFNSNTNDLGYGAAVFNAGQLIARGSFFGFNNGQNAGTIFSTAGASMYVTNCTFESNISHYSGPAIGTESTNGTARITHSVFKNNQVAFSEGFQVQQVYAGGGAVVNAGVLSISASSFQSNFLRSSVWGGAVLNNGTMSVVDSTFEGNSATNPIARGGAVFNGGTLGLTNITFAGNRARYGSAVDNELGVMMRMVNCTVARNVQELAETFALHVGGGFVNMLENNLVVENDRWDAAITNFVPANLTGFVTTTGTNFIGNTNVLLGVLTTNGGPVKTMALPSGSPAVNAGFAVAGLTTDARGQPRYEQPDLGAYELPTFAPIFTSPTSTILIKGQSNAFQFTATSGLPVSFAPLTSFPTGMNLALDGLLSGDPTVPSGFYQSLVRAYTDYSLTDAPFSMTVTDGTTDDRFSWQLNGGAELTNQVFTLTDGGIGQSRSAWYLFEQDINAFQVSFEYLNVGGGGADGVAFVVQNAPAGLAALGGGGGGLGYTGISPSFALMINIYAGAPGGPGIQVTTGGAGITTNNPYIPTPQANPASADPIRFDLTYVGGSLTVTMTNLTSSASFTTNFPVDIPVAVSDNQAWIGFTAATGGATATQRVSNFSFTSLSSVSTVIVNNATDPGGFNTNVILSTLGTNITLRDAVNAANNHSSPVVIRFDPALAGATIDLEHAGDSASGPTALPIRGQIIIENTTTGSLTISRAVTNDLRLFRVSTNGSLTLRNLRLENGRVSSGGQYGGNIDNQGALVIEDSVIAGGYSFSGGGGLHNAGATRVDRTIFESNIGRNAGGGIFNSNTLAIAASTIVSNRTATNGGGPLGGGGIQNLGTLFVTNSTFAYNVAGTNSPGGAIWNASGSFELTHCTVFGNGAGSSSPGIGGFQNSALVRNNIIADGSSITPLAGSVSNLFSNPGLGAFGSNGGPTPTFPITAVSAAHRAGAAIPGLTTDQRGVARHAAPDIGAFELFPRDPLIVSTLVDEDDGTADVEQGTGTSLREALTYAQNQPGPQTITFAPALAGQTVLLDTGWTSPADESALAVTGSVTLQGLTSAPGIMLAVASNVQKRHFLVQAGGSLTLRHLTLTGGQAASGGSVLINLGSLSVRDCTFTGNLALEGGAIYAWLGSPLLVVENSTFAGNIAANLGSAIGSAASSNLFQHITVTSNSGPNALFLNGCIVPIQNSIVAGNSADGVLGTSGGAFHPDSGGNVFGTGGAAGITNGVNGNVTGVDAPNLFLGSLSITNGGPTPTVALLPNSPAINRGAPLAGFSTDQRGVNRVIGFAPDAGAFEFVLVESGTVTATNDEFDVTSDASFGAGTSLREALYYTTGAVGFSSNLTGQTVELTQVGDAQFGNTAILLTNLSVRFIRAPQAPRLTIRVNGAEPMRHFRVATGASIVLQNLTLVGGHATNGGAVYNQGTLSISLATLASNTAIQSGGAVFSDSNATLRVITSTLSGNAAGGWGGAIANQGTNYITHATIAGNTAATSGGGIYNEPGAAPTTMEATIVAGNTDGLAAPSDIGGIPSFGVGSIYNLIGPGGSGGLVDGVNSNRVGVSDPGLAPLAQYGGRTPTRALYPWSPAVDACFLIGASTDQRGFIRDDPRDIGAFELRLSTNEVNLGGLTRNGAGGGAGAIEFDFAGGVPGASFSVYATTNAMTPVDQWQWIGLVPETPPDSSLFRANLPIDTNAPNRFFRVQSP